MFIAQSLSVIQGWLQIFDIPDHIVNYHITYIVLSLTYTISGLVLYRINLIYLKWKSLQPITAITTAKILNQRNSVKNISDAPRVTISQLFYKKVKVIQNIYKTKLSIILICFVSIGSILVYVSYIIFLNTINIRINMILFIILWISIIASILNIKHKKVEEGIGCLNECYAILFALLIQLTLQIAIPYNKDTYINILQYSAFFVLNFQGMVTLYIPLILLFKSESTLNINEYKNEIDGKIFKNHSSKNKNKNDTYTNSKDLNNIIIPNHNENKKNSLDIVCDDKVSSNDSTIFINKSLFEFLGKNKLNHSIFTDYLRVCFALENLLFIERTSIFYEIVLKLKQKNEWSLLTMKSPATNRQLSNENGVLSPSNRTSQSFPANYILTQIDINENNIGSPKDTLDSPLTPELNTPVPKSFNFEVSKHDEDIDNDVNERKLNRFEFKYLKTIYNEYEKIIENVINNSDNKYEEEQYGIGICRKPLFDICQEIYDTFVSCFAQSQINISHESFEHLEMLFDGERLNENSINKFESYQNFLCLFDNAMVETYILMINVYGYQFKKYVINRYPHAKFEK